MSDDNTSDYAYIANCAQRRKPIPGDVFAGALEDAWGEGGEEMASKVHNIVEAANIAGVVCYGADEMIRAATAMTHASYAEDSIPF